MFVIRSYNANGAFQQVLKLLYTDGEICGPRGLQTKEVTNLLIEMTQPLSDIKIDNKYHKFDQDYADSEIAWYRFHGKLATISEHSSFWKTLYTKNYPHPINSNYGYRIEDNSFFTEKKPFNQFEMVFNILKKDKDSRQAIINIKLPLNLENKPGNLNDIPCTQTIQFMIRNNRLDMSVNMRSNDLIYGFCYDQYYFTKLMTEMYLKLKTIYNDLVIGSYYHYTTSMHIYERHWNKFDKLKEE